MLFQRAIQASARAPSCSSTLRHAADADYRLARAFSDQPMHLCKRNLRRWLLGTRDAHAIYAQFGFTPLGAPERLMERYDPNVYARMNDATGSRRGGLG